MPEDQIKSQEPTPEAIGQFVKALVKEVKEPKDPTALYANNTTFEVSAWDLKIFFGQLDQRLTKMSTDWHTAMTMPWAQARLLEYYLRLNILFYEKKYGPITLPPQVVPQAFPYPTKEQIESDPQAVELWEAYRKVYQDMFGGPEYPTTGQPLSEDLKKLAKDVTLPGIELTGEEK
jgi:hypothetical protein